MEFTDFQGAGEAAATASTNTVSHSTDNSSKQHSQQQHPPALQLDHLTLYETKQSFFLLGCNSKALQPQYRILCVDRTRPVPTNTKTTAPSGATSPTPPSAADYESRLHVTEDVDTYERREDATDRIKHLIRAQSSPAPPALLSKPRKISALLGFIRLPQLYMFIVTKKQHVGRLCHQPIYTISDTQLLPVHYDDTVEPSTQQQIRHKLYAVGQRYRQLFNGLDFKRDYYFSYSYDLTHTLQHNVCQSQQPAGNTTSPAAAPTIEPNNTSHTSTTVSPTSHPAYNEQFTWNLHLAYEFLQQLPTSSYWLVSLIHGFVAQSRGCRLANQNIKFTVIARRSRHFAGTRYIKRGIDPTGYVANEVESELISECNGQYGSSVFLRGSIPLPWSQDNPFSTKPTITVHTNDQNFVATHLHFEHLFTRYSEPIHCYSLIKQVEKNPQECKLGYAFSHAIQKLNDVYKQREDSDDDQQHHLNYHTYDFLTARAQKGNVLRDIRAQMSTAVNDISYFHVDASATVTKTQKGIVRINCVDCLDRTNVAMFCCAKLALRQHLRAFQLIEKSTTDDDLPDDILLQLQTIFTEHGDRIATQYAGSGAMHKEILFSTDKDDQPISAAIDTAAGIQAQKQRDGLTKEKASAIAMNALTAAKRYYHNNVTDFDKQSSINLLLGNYIPTVQTVLQAHNSNNSLSELSNTTKQHIWDLEPAAATLDADELYGSSMGEAFKLPYNPNPIALTNTNHSTDDDDEEQHELSDDEVSTASEEGESAAATSGSFGKMIQQTVQNVDKASIGMFGRQLANRFSKAISQGSSAFGARKDSASSTGSNSGKSQPAVGSRKIDVESMMSHIDTPRNPTDTGDNSGRSADSTEVRSPSSARPTADHSAGRPPRRTHSNPAISDQLPGASTDSAATSSDPFAEILHRPNRSPSSANDHKPLRPSTKAEKQHTAELDLLSFAQPLTTNENKKQTQPNGADLVNDPFAELYLRASTPPKRPPPLPANTTTDKPAVSKLAGGELDFLT